MDDPQLRVEQTPDGLALCDDAQPRQRGFLVDFTTIDIRTGPGNLSRHQPLARAVGDHHQTVIDATAGFAHDAALLALMGFTVTAIERCPMVVALVRDALERAARSAAYGPRFEGHLDVCEGDAVSVLPTLPAPDVVYLDPMYPPKPKAALPPKAAQLLRRLVGDDGDAHDLFEVARAHARHRVVVKRPHHAEPLGDAPSHAIKSKLARWDVYVVA